MEIFFKYGVGFKFRLAPRFGLYLLGAMGVLNSSDLTSIILQVLKQH